MLKELRIKNNLSQSQLANQAGISVRTLQDYEQERKNINCAKAITVYKLSKILNCNIEDILKIKNVNVCTRNGPKN